MLDLIICANFGVEKLRGLENTRGQILEFPIEMAGHFYNRAGATAQPVMCTETALVDLVIMCSSSCQATDLCENDIPECACKKMVRFI